jgi:hypothetical protein
VQRDVNLLQDAFHVFNEVAVPESQNPISFVLQPLRPPLIARFDRFVPMLRAIELDDEVCRHAGKIGHVRANGYLPSEVTAKHRQSAKLPPKASFGIGRVCA